MLLLTVFQALVHRYARQADVLVGAPVAGRTDAATEGLIGLFVNTIVLRSRITADTIFRQMLATTREEALGAFAHQALPFEKLVAELHPDRDLSRAPVVQVLFSFQDARLEPVALRGLEVRVHDLDVATPKCDLELSLRRSAEGLVGRARVRRGPVLVGDRRAPRRWARDAPPRGPGERRFACSSCRTRPRRHDHPGVTPTLAARG
jgi:non-ribosomal peptide synthetase component F